jgi:hypothetical protein
MSPKPLPGIRFFLLISATLFLTAPVPAGADVVQLKPDHPERYTVVKGDTLWDISTRFLRSPWHWPRIWKINEQIKNPHLIYPGDVLVLRWVDGQPQISLLRRDKVEPEPMVPTVPALPPTDGVPDQRPTDPRTVRVPPRVHEEPIAAAIPTIPPSAIEPFLTQPLAVDKNELRQAGYITVGLDNRLTLGDQSEFYARGFKGESKEYYHIFRPGKPIRHPDTGELLAYEAVYLGDARRLEGGDPAKFVVTSVKQEIQPSDRLLVAERTAALPFYLPQAPKNKVNGRVVAALNSVSEIGPFSIVAITLGKREGMEQGTVLRIMRSAGRQRDPVAGGRYRLPDEESGLAMVFRVFDKMSYALIMTSTRPVHLNDAVTNP